MVGVYSEPSPAVSLEVKLIFGRVIRGRALVSYGEMAGPLFCLSMVGHRVDELVHCQGLARVAARLRQPEEAWWSPKQ